MSARVTVCIPAYKNPAYLSDALTCLCDQGLRREEYVVAVSEDWSEVSLEPVVTEFAARLQIEHSRSSERLGHLKNFERAVAMARTPMISILPHDDVIAPGQLARVLPLLEGEPGAVMAGSRVVCQKYPGAAGAHLLGNLIRREANQSFLEPYVWTSSEWMASALVGTPMCMVGAVFSTDAFRRCKRWISFPMWHDRVWCAELGVQGTIISSPWVGGYYRVSESQLSAQLAKTNESEFRQVSEFVLDLCERHDIAALGFWVDQICAPDAGDRAATLRLLHFALPAATFQLIKAKCEQRLGTSLNIGGRLARWGVPWHLAETLRGYRKVLRS